MRNLLLFLATIGSPAMAADESRVPSTLSAPLAKALAGRTAGTPTDCISLSQQARSSMIVDDSAIIYKESRRRWWVNFPNGGSCSALRSDRSLVTVTPGNRICSLELVRVVDLLPAFDYGSCALGPFVPYTR